jgi:acetyl-CoA synthetase
VSSKATRAPVLEALPFEPRTLSLDAGLAARASATAALYAEADRQTYWSRFPGRYLTGDGAKRDEDGDVWLLGRVDDVINVAGQAVFAFVTLEAGHAASDALAVQLREHVAYVIGPIARPAYLLFTPHLPRTRSGAIMRRLLREIAEGRSPGDTSSLADASVVDTIREHADRAED